MTAPAHPPFLIYGLPRSRTFWLSRFLSYADWFCGHDELRYARSMVDVRSWLTQPCTGTVETAAAPFWRLVKAVRTVVVRRPVAEVVDSLMRMGMSFDTTLATEKIRRLDRKLDQIERRIPGTLSVQFADLADEATCARIFEHCLPYKHDSAWYAWIAALNLQTNMVATLRYYEANKHQLDKLAQVAKQQTLAAMPRKTRDTDGITIQQESFDTSFPDATALLAEHCVQVGESPDSFRRKNIPLMQTLEKMGALQVTTARSNGRMFGYLMAVVSPSLESPDIQTATHTTFFVSRDAPGIGLKLQRASIEALRERGVDQVFLHAGVRGSGPRMPSVYRRLGAESCGEVFKLEMQRNSRWA